MPENAVLRELSGVEVDIGLANHVEGEELEGKFKTPSLRNVAVTSPYMHNGIFRELSTVLAFYEHQRRVFSEQDDASVNPETGEDWGTPEIERNLSEIELRSGNKDLMVSANSQALVCFLLSLADARYEALLDADEVEECGL